MELFLIRHGKAEGRKESIEDINRSLTDIGKAGIETLIPTLIERINGEKNIAIWSSPAVRSDETAKLIAKGLGADSVVQFDFILDGDFNLLIENLRGIDEEVTLLLVGHEPHLSKWSKRLTGKVVHFKKEMVAGIHVKTLDPVSADLEWIEKPGNHKKCVKKQHPGLTVKELKHIMLELLTEIAEHLKQYPNHPDDMEIVHDIRVKLRQARSFVSLMKQMLQEEEYSHYQSMLQGIAHSFSLLRELDVVYEQWNHILEQNDRLAEDSHLLEMLKNRRENEKIKVGEYITSIQITHDLDALTAWIGGLQESDPEDIRLTKSAVEKFMDWNESIAKDTVSLQYDDIAAMHALRLLCKKVRYVQSGSVFLAGKKKYSISKLKKLQEDLGWYCDINNNIAIVEGLKPVSQAEEFLLEKGFFIGYLFGLREAMIRQH